MSADPRLAEYPPLTDAEKDRLKDLYAQMSALTAPSCAACPTAFSCCASHHCEVAMAWAKFAWGVELAPTGHPALPLLGARGCTAPAHLRPICTVHTCCINELGEDPADPAWTQRYFDLREQIEEIEGDLLENADMVDPNRQAPRLR